MRIIPDSSAAPGASALLLTFGGDVAGNRNAFTQGLVPSGETGAIGVSFNWICNIIRPQLASGLGVPASDFDSPCHLNTTVNLPGDHNPQLTQLDLTLVNGAISVSAGVGASDTGWNASATVGGSIFIAVQNGNLIITSNIADPSINVSLDWWVWLASAVVGAIVGGIIAGVIGAVVGAIVVPLIVWIASSVINSIIQNVANQIVSALRQLNLNVNVPAVGVNIVFQEINIDDIVIGTRVQFVDNAPIRSQGTLTVYDGQYIDLDNGSVGDSSLQGADLAWVGQEPRRALETLCCGLLARTGGKVFDLTRSQLYRLYYQAGVSIPETELGSLEGSIPPVVIFGITVVPAIPIPGGEIFVPSDLVYAVETDEGRFSIVQVVGGFEPNPPSAIASQTATTAPAQSTTATNPTLAVALSSSATAGIVAYAARSSIITNQPAPRPRGYISLRYRTFEKPAPNVRTIGGGLTTQGLGLQNAQDVVGVTVPVGQATFVPAAVYPSVEGRPGSFNPGTWWVEKVTKNPRHATIKALTPGIQAKAHHWSINRRPVEGSKGSVKLGDGTVSYQISGDAIEVSHSSESSLTFEVGVTVVATDGTQQTATTCVQTGGESTVTTVAAASWSVFQDTFLGTFGNIDP